MNKSLVDIINKCKGKYQRYSKQDVFGFEQIVKLTMQDMKNNVAMKESHKGSHKGIYNPFGITGIKAKMGKAIQNAKPYWQGTPGIDCDDPLYDGKPVF